MEQYTREEDDVAVSPSDPFVILAGIKQFGLAPDGSDLNDLAAALKALHIELSGAKQSLDAIRESNEALRKEGEAKEQEITNLKARIAHEIEGQGEFANQRDHANAELTTAQETVARLEARNKQQKIQIARLNTALERKKE